MFHVAGSPATQKIRGEVAFALRSVLFVAPSCITPCWSPTSSSRSGSALCFLSSLFLRVGGYRWRRRTLASMFHSELYFFRITHLFEFFILKTQIVFASRAL
jgi:hypothetical protein